MNTLNTDLLPPLFDQVMTHYGGASPWAYARSDIVKALENGIVNSAADKVRADRALGNNESSEYVELLTVDRLSGSELSRGALIEQLQRTVLVDKLVLEIGLLLVEAQIDLRLKGGKDFEISGIKFVNREAADIATWCQRVLESTMHGAANDTPTLWSSFRRKRPEGLRILVEGLQLSATLRDAVPYRIKVAWRLIEPLLSEARQDERIRLLHISDLHLVEDIAEPGRNMQRPFGVATHNFNTARNLGLTVGVLKPPFDMVLATGDLTTDGSRGSLETLRQYIQSGSVTGANPMRIATYGLNAGSTRRLLLPGNHDRFDGKSVPGQRLSSLFEEVLETRKSYPYVVGYRPPNKPSTSLTLLFFVFDSSLPLGRRSNNARDWTEALSIGYIGEEESTKLVSQARDVVENRKVESFDGEILELNPANTIRIAALHHHPVVTVKSDTESEKSLWRRWTGDPLAELGIIKKDVSARLMRMDGADGFLSSCFRAGVQLVLFGHQHHPYQRLIMPESGGPIKNPFGYTDAIHAFCCPTTLEYEAAANGFYVFDFFDKAKVSVEPYLSRRNGKPESPPFTPDTDTSRSFDLTLTAADFSPADLNSAYRVRIDS